MSITYKWSFPALDVTYNEIDPQTGKPVRNAVNTVHWVYTAKDGDYTSTMYSTVGLPAPGQPFVDYSDLTPEIVEGWVVSALGEATVEEMKASLAGSIESQKAPKGGVLPPPWG